MNILYLTNLPQTPFMNGSSETCKCLASYKGVGKIIHLDTYKPTIEFKKIFTRRNTKIIFELVRYIFSDQKYIDFTYVNFLPFQRFDKISKLNQEINYKIMNFIFKKTGNSTVFISSYPFYKTVKFIKSRINIEFIISDCTDIWPLNTVKYMSHVSIYFCVNSQFMADYLRPYVGKTKLISSGYFPKSLIDRLKNKNIGYKNENKLTLISSVNWRVNFAFLIKLLNKLKNYKLNLVGNLVFDFFKESGWNYKNNKIMSYWKKIQKSKNFTFTEIDSQNSLPNINIQNSVGLITYDLKDRFNRFSHPIKLYHYFAAGIPVVSVPIPSIIYLKNKGFIKFSNNVSGFSKSILYFSKKKLKIEEKKEMLDIAYRQTFETKANDLVKLISEIKMGGD
jgi:hypothetical protein